MKQVRVILSIISWLVFGAAAYSQAADVVYSKLNVVAEISPVIWYPSPLSIAAGKAVGEENGRRIYPVKSLLQAGALVIYGSDWPSVDPEFV